MNEIRQVIASTFQIPLASVADDASNQTLPQWDSLGHITLVMALEQHFGVSFTLDEIVEMRDLATIQRLLEGKRP